MHPKEPQIKNSVVKRQADFDAAQASLESVRRPEVFKSSRIEDESNKRELNTANAVDTNMTTDEAEARMKRTGQVLEWSGDAATVAKSGKKTKFRRDFGLSKRGGRSANVKDYDAAVAKEGRTHRNQYTNEGFDRNGRKSTL